jgi:hypothetical protein
MSNFYVNLLTQMYEAELRGIQRYCSRHKQQRTKCTDQKCVWNHKEIRLYLCNPIHSENKHGIYYFVVINGIDDNKYQATVSFSKDTNDRLYDLVVKMPPRETLKECVKDLEEIDNIKLKDMKVRY